MAKVEYIYLSIIVWSGDIRTGLQVLYLKSTPKFFTYYTHMEIVCKLYLISLVILFSTRYFHSQGMSFQAALLWT